MNRQSVFSESEKEEISVIMDYITKCGLYAQKLCEGEISDKNIDISKIAYTDDNLYDIIADKIGKLQREFPQPIPYHADKNIKR